MLGDAAGAVSVGAAALLALVLGLRHGIDADHLAAIDALTRRAALAGAGAARWQGTWFALGHGLVVVAVAGGVQFAAQRWQAPDWLAPVGSITAAAMLTALGVANLHAAWHKHGTASPSAGTPALWLLNWTLRGPLRSNGAAAAMAAGALFALSFDTIGHAALFAWTGRSTGSPFAAVLLALLFVLGMLTADTINGWVVGRLIRTTDSTSHRSARWMSLVVAMFSLAAAAMVALPWLSPETGAGSNAYRHALSAALLLTIGVTAWVARRAKAASQRTS